MMRQKAKKLIKLTMGQSLCISCDKWATHQVYGTPYCPLHDPRKAGELNQDRFVQLTLF